jgi:hypothetical protein
MTAAVKLIDATAIAHDIDATTDTLETIADWKDNLRARIARARLRFELVRLDEDKQDELVNEVEQFKNVCRALTRTGSAAA